MDANHWRKRAAECKAIAETMGDAGIRSQMLDVAASYEQMAEQAERMMAKARAMRFEIALRRAHGDPAWEP